MSKSVSEQTTLKQIMRDQRAKHYHLYGDTIPYDPIDGVREWLQQKQKEAFQKHSGISAMVAIDILYDELLEDLDK